MRFHLNPEARHTQCFARCLYAAADLTVNVMVRDTLSAIEGGNSYQGLIFASRQYIPCNPQVLAPLDNLLLGLSEVCYDAYDGQYGNRGTRY